MYFHSSSYRHEQYAALRSASSRADGKKKKKRSSLSSNTSGADSGYTSSASSSPNATQPSPLSARVAAETQQVAKATEPSPSSGATTPKKPKKKRSGTKNQLGPPRQPDLVYSCPRPLAFPFHNDAHFLPVAEADPRDVARVAPPSSRRQSAASSKASSLASSQFDQHSAYRYRSLRSKSSYDDDTETLRSRQSSIISSMQRGTVRSLRSLFQIPTPHHPPVESQRPEIKKGTVRHIREMFNSDEATSSNLAIAERNAEANSRKPRLFDRITGRKPIQQNQRSRASSVTSTATTLCNKPLPKAPTHVDKLLADAPPVPTKPPSAFATFKRMFSRSSAKKQPSSSSTASQASPASLPKKVTVSPTTTSAQSPPPPPPPPTPPKRSILSTWLRPDPPKPKDQPKPADSTKPKDQPKPAQVEPEAAPTVVGRLWKSFKRMVTGKKTSRVGVL